MTFLQNTRMAFLFLTSLKNTMWPNRLSILFSSTKTTFTNKITKISEARTDYLHSFLWGKLLRLINRTGLSSLTDVRSTVYIKRAHDDKERYICIYKKGT